MRVAQRATPSWPPWHSSDQRQQNNEKTETDVNSSTIHESKKPGNIEEKTVDNKVNENLKPKYDQNKEKTKINDDRSTVHESKKTSNIVEPVNKNVNQIKDTFIKKVNENQKQKNVHNQEKAKTDVDSCTVHESKKSRNSVNKNVKQKEDTILNKVDENQKPENLQNQEKTKTDVDSKNPEKLIIPVNKGVNQKENTTVNKVDEKQKPENGKISPKVREIQSATEKNDEIKTLDLKAKTNRINSDEFIFYANPKINLGSQKLKASTDRINSDEFQEYVNPIIDLENIISHDFQGDENSDKIISPTFDSSDIKKSSKNPPGQIVISNEIQKPVPEVEKSDLKEKNVYKLIEKGFAQESIHESKESNCDAMKLIDNYKSSEEDGLESDVKEIGKTAEKNAKKRRRQKKSGEFNCPSCDKFFSRKNNMKEHIKFVHDGKIHKCPLCDEFFSRKDNLKKHVKIVHEGETLKCSLCDDFFALKDKLYNHVKVVHDGKKLKCPLCDVLFSKKECKMK